MTVESATGAGASSSGASAPPAAVPPSEAKGKEGPSGGPSAGRPSPAGDHDPASCDEELGLPAEEAAQPSAPAPPKPGGGAAAAAPVADGKAEKEKVCIICLSEPVQIMFVPCRHAVVCKECSAQLHSRRDVCPICRSAITNTVEGDFQDDYVRLVTAAELRVWTVKASAYDGMYNHIRPLMVIGVLAGVGSVIGFVVPGGQGAGIGLAVVAVSVGYIPWFATTVVAFEREDLAEANAELAPHQHQLRRLFTRADLGAPLTLAVKVVVLTVATPVALAVFFAPYAVFACFVRPLARVAFASALRGTCFGFVYVARPLLRCIDWTLSKMCQLLCRGLWELCRCLYWTVKAACKVAAAVGRCVSWVLGRICHGICVACEAVHEHVLVPVYDFSCFCGNLVFHYVLVPLGQAVYWLRNALCYCLTSVGGCAKQTTTGAAKGLYRWVLVPVGRGVAACGRATAQGATACGRAVARGAQATKYGIWAYFLSPLGKAVAWTGKCLYERALVPTAQGACKLAELTGRGITWLCVAFYDWVLTPCGKGLRFGLAQLWRGTKWLAKQTYRFVIKPFFTALWWFFIVILAILYLLGKALVITAQFLYAYGVVPFGRGCAYVVRLVAKGLTAFGRGIAFVARGIYEHALCPAARGVAACGRAAGGAVASGASFVYRGVLVPCGAAAHAGAIAVGQGVAGGARAVYSHVLQPTCQATAAAGAAARQACVAAGREVAGAGRAACRTVQDAVRAVGSAFRGGGGSGPAAGGQP